MRAMELAAANAILMGLALVDALVLMRLIVPGG